MSANINGYVMLLAMDDAHEMITAIKAMAAELGRVPTRVEFLQSMKAGQYWLQKLFRNYAALCQAAGLETYSERRKITSQIFEKKIDTHLEAHKPKIIAPEPEPWPKIVSISDIHWPFHYQPVIDRFYRRLEAFNPEYVILNGDAWDMYAHSKFPRSHNIFTPREEMRLARELNEKFWLEVKARVPAAKCVQLLGNHDLRPMKRILEEYPEAEDWLNEKVKQAFTFDGVETIYDPRQELIIAGIAIFHGYRTQLGAHRDYTLMNCINGHTHLGGVTYRQVHGKILWEANSGFAGDPESKGLTYTPQRLSKWTWGHLEVDENGPKFLPFRSL